MKKFYSLVLMAAALLIGTNVWAVNVASLSQIQEAIDNTPVGGTVDLTLTTDVSVDAPIQIYAKKAEAGKTVNLNLAGNTITASAKVAVIELLKGTLNLVGPGTIATTQNYEAIRVYGAFDDVPNWSNLNIGNGVRVTSESEATGDDLKANAISIIEFSAPYYTYVKPEYAGQDLKDIDPEEYKVASYITKNNGTIAYQNTPVYTSSTTASVKALFAANKIDYGAGYYTAGTSVKTYTKSGVSYSWVKVGSIRYAAYGVNVDVQEGAYIYASKYGIKVNGNIKTKGVYSPYIHIANGAEVKVAPEANQAVAVYSSGYGVFVIEGEVHGSTGVYVKGGSVIVEDGAKIYSDNNTGNGIGQLGKGSGIDAGGNAIAIEGRNGNYTSEGVSVQINGGTITAGEGAYAVQNLNNAEAQEVPTAVTISGGEFNGGQIAGCVAIDNSDPEHPVEVELTGGTFTGDIETLIAAVDDGENIIQEIVEQGEQGSTVVIGKKEDGDVVDAPTTSDEIEEFAFDEDKDIVKLNATDADIEKTLEEDLVEVKYLSLTGSGAFTSTVTVADGQTLKVGQIVMNANGRIIVEAGATLIVTGENGIFAENIENLVLETEEGKHSSFLLTPDVNNNYHPKATVQFVSKSYNVSATNYRNQRFGIPTIGALESITAEYQGSPVQTRIWGYFNGSWVVIGDLNTGAEFDKSKMNQPFAYYQMNNKADDTGSIITMTGNLVGVANPELEVTANNWSTFANSFMANMNAAAMLDMFDGHDNIDQSLQTYTPTSANTFAWFPFNFSNILMGEIVNIEPMQAFIIKNNGEADQLQMNYKSMVWDEFPGAGKAPRRRVAAANDMTTARIEVRNAAGVYDFVTLLEDNRFDAEYNNGYDAEKVMNNTLDLYTVGAKNQATLATDNLNNTYVGLNCEEAGTYTISFSHINGAELTLVDHETGARVAMVEGNTYEFTAAANTVNDYRFEIVESAKLPTAIENTEAVKSAKGIYTITGQFVGEMNVWNTLPAGIYVINGEKRVK